MESNSETIYIFYRVQIRFFLIKIQMGLSWNEKTFGTLSLQRKSKIIRRSKAIKKRNPRWRSRRPPPSFLSHSLSSSSDHLFLSCSDGFEVQATGFPTATLRKLGFSVTLKTCERVISKENFKKIDKNQLNWRSF
jgi:hypothetical protein